MTSWNIKLDIFTFRENVWNVVRRMVSEKWEYPISQEVDSVHINFASSFAAEMVHLFTYVALVVDGIGFGPP